MSSNIPQDSFPVNHSLPTHLPYEHSQGSLQGSPQTITDKNISKDKVQAASPDKNSSAPTLGETGIPSLPAPQSSNISIEESFRAWTQAIRGFREQLRASDKANLEVRNKFSLLAVSQAEEFSKILADKQAGVTNLNQEIKKILDDLNLTLDEMKKLVQDQQKEITKINGGNRDEQQAYAELTHAYDSYIAQMKSIGAIDLGEGHFSIPEEGEKKEAYDKMTKDYQQAIISFNTYQKGRSDQINHYQTATLAYNQKATEYNKKINEFIIQNQLSDDLKLIPQMIQADRKDSSDSLDEIMFPSQNGDSPSVYIPPLPLYVQTITQIGPSAITELANFPSFDTQILFDELYSIKYESRIAPLDQAMIQYNNYQSFIIRQNIQNIDNDLSPEDLLLNSKMLAKLLFYQKKPDGQSEITLNNNSMVMETISLNHSNTQSILGSLLIKEAIEQSDLKFFQLLSGEKKEKKVMELVNKIILLSVSLMGNQSMQALFPSLAFLSETLISLPKDSPAFAILFAVSLCNRMGEDIKHGTITVAFEKFLGSIPEFAELSVEDRLKLEASLNIGQLLVAGKLLEDSLGLQGLWASILPPLLPSCNWDQIISQAKEEDKQSQLELYTRTVDHFIEKGYPEDKAHFFAQVGDELTATGLLSPNVTAQISEKTIFLPLLKNSVKAALALSHPLSLSEAQTIANETLTRTFESATYLTAHKFRSTLESELADQGVRNSREIALAALFTLPNEKKMTPSVKLSPAELTTLIEKQTIQVLVPSIDPSLAKQISHEITQTLFGTSTDSSPKTNLQSPYALVNVMQEQLALLNFEDHEHWAAALHETFAETLKTVTSFPEFSKKLQDPAYKYVLASSLIYEQQGSKKMIDIPI